MFCKESLGPLLRNGASDSERSAASFLNNAKNYLVDTHKWLVYEAKLLVLCDFLNKAQNSFCVKKRLNSLKRNLNKSSREKGIFDVLDLIWNF